VTEASLLACVFGSLSVVYFQGNRETQTVVLEVGLTQPLWSVVQRSPDLSVKESAASALWTATRADVEERQRVAELMGPSTFSQFLATALTSSDKANVSSELLVIGAEGIEVNNHPCAGFLMTISYGIFCLRRFKLAILYAVYCNALQTAQTSVC